MARPKHTNPTPAELELLNLLWQHGPATVREVIDRMPKPRGYTTVMSLMQVMYEKKLLTRVQEGRAFRYSPKVSQEKTLGKMLGDLLGRAFAGSSSTLVQHLLQHSNPSDGELAAIRQAIEAYEHQRESDS